MLLWERAREPFLGAWALPGGALGPGETLEESIRRHLAAKVDVRELSHLEQLETLQRPRPAPRAAARSRPPTSGSSRARRPRGPGGHALAPGGRPAELAFDHGSIALAGRERLRAKLSYTNIGFALAPPVVHDRRAPRALPRGARARRLGDEPPARARAAGLLEPTGERRPPGRAGGRPRRSSASAAGARGHRPVRRPPASGPRKAGTAGLNSADGLVHHLLHGDPEDPGALPRLGHLVGRQGPARTGAGGELGEAESDARWRPLARKPPRGPAARPARHARAPAYAVAGLPLGPRGSRDPKSPPAGPAGPHLARRRGLPRGGAIFGNPSRSSTTRAGWGPGAILVALIAAAMGGSRAASRRSRSPSRPRGWFLGMVVAIVLERPIF